MNRSKQLTQLICDFWREETEELKQLTVLEECKVSRWWGVLHIHCSQRESAQKIMAVEPLIEQPVRELRLANQVKIWVNNKLFTIFRVNSQKMDNFQEVRFDH